jgi:16S rRNA processing protein RimM
MGRIAAPYAVRGWVKVQTFTEYLDSLMDYPVWRLGRLGKWQRYTLQEARPQGHYLVAHFTGIDDRDRAETLVGLEVAVARSEMPAAADGEYYWDDLIGLEVVNLQDQPLGIVEGLLETGASDVLRVKGERPRLIPFVDAIVQVVDLECRRIVVDWGQDY